MIGPDSAFQPAHAALLENLDAKLDVDYMGTKTHIERALLQVTGIRVEVSSWHSGYRIEPAELIAPNSQDRWLWSQVYNNRSPRLRQSISAAVLDFVALFAEHRWRLRHRNKPARGSRRTGRARR